jgi:hypothetical protein
LIDAKLSYTEHQEKGHEWNGSAKGLAALVPAPWRGRQRLLGPWCRRGGPAEQRRRGPIGRRRVAMAAAHRTRAPEQRTRTVVERRTSAAAVEEGGTTAA